MGEVLCMMWSFYWKWHPCVKLSSIIRKLVIEENAITKTGKAGPLLSGAVLWAGHVASTPSGGWAKPPRHLGKGYRIRSVGCGFASPVYTVILHGSTMALHNWLLLGGKHITKSLAWGNQKVILHVTSEQGELVQGCHLQWQPSETQPFLHSSMSSNSSARRNRGMHKTTKPMRCCNHEWKRMVNNIQGLDYIKQLGLSI